MDIPNIEIVSVEGTDAFVRALSLLEFTAYMEQLEASSNAEGEAPGLLVRATLCDADGTLLYANGEAAPIDDWPAAFVLKICEASVALNMPGGDPLGN